MSVTILEGRDLVNPVFGTDLGHTGKVVLFPDSGGTADVLLEDGTARNGLPLAGLANGNIRIKQIVTSSVAANEIWIAIR